MVHPTFTPATTPTLRTPKTALFKAITPKPGVGYYLGHIIVLWGSKRFVWAFVAFRGYLLYELPQGFVFWKRRAWKCLVASPRSLFLSVRRFLFEWWRVLWFYFISFIQAGGPFQNARCCLLSCHHEPVSSEEWTGLTPVTQRKV